MWLPPVVSVRVRGQATPLLQKKEGIAICLITTMYY